MRKLFAILLIGIFAFSQYARQLSYLECTFSNVFKTDAAKCDCEKQAGFRMADDDRDPVSRNHTHIHLDEFFATVKHPAEDISQLVIALITYHSQAEDECEGELSKPSQPPNS